MPKPKKAKNTFKLTPKLKRFAENLSKGMSVYDSAINVGYTESYAKSRAYELSEKISIKKYLKELDEKIQTSNIATAQEIQEFLTRQMRGEMKEQCVATVGIGNGNSEVIIANKDITPKDRQKAAETLAKIKRLFDEDISTPITINITRDYA